MRLAAAAALAPPSKVAAIARASFLAKVEGKASSGSNFISRLISGVERNSERADLSLYLESERRSKIYLANPIFRSAMSSSSTQAEGMKVVVKRRLGGRL